MGSIDPITLSVVWGGLVSVSEQMGITLRRSAYSVGMRESRDLSAALTDAQGRLIAQGNFSPAHLGSFPYVIRHVLDAFPPDTLEPGDVILLNDSAMGSGHLLDFMEASPVFWEGQLAGFALACGHMPDVGGTGPGSQAVNAMDFYQEGIRFLPIKLYARGEPNKTLFEVLAANVRVPNIVLGDVRAMRNALRMGEMGFHDLLAAYGLETIRACSDEIIQRSEARMREAIAEIPDGEYTAEDFYDDCGEGTSPLKFKITIRVKGSDIVYDFSGSSPQTTSGVNAYLSYTRAYCIFLTKCLTLRDSWPQNEGCVRPIHVVAPEGCLFNAQRPAGGGARAIMNSRFAEVIIRAMATALPDRVIASNSDWDNPNMGGIDPRTGEHFVFYDIILGGSGASSARDGVEAHGSVVNNTSIPIEVAESTYPVLIDRLELVQDTGGPGRYRGATTLRKDVRVLADNLVYSNLTDRHHFSPQGLFGGGAGPPGVTLLNPGTPQECRAHSKGVFRLSHGDVVSNTLSATGGYGDSLERDSAAVLMDVRSGYVSEEAAAREYGVVVDSTRWEVLQKETAQLRAKLKRQR